MDIVLSFFRDTLDGPFYIAWVVLLVILIFACIGYLAEKSINNKKETSKYAVVDNKFDNNVGPVNSLNNQVISSNQVNDSNVVNTPVVEEVLVNNINESNMVSEQSSLNNTLTASQAVVPSIPTINNSTVEEVKINQANIS